MSLQILTGDCRELLRTLPDQSVHCVVTSPPYFGLRDYGTAQWEGGDPDCQHGSRIMGNANKGNVREVLDMDRAKCFHCGARRIDSQIGLEPTPDAYVAELVQVFREVRRVLRDDGTVWLNLGDSYATSPPGNKPNTSKDSSGLPNSRENLEMRRAAQSQINKTKLGLKPKDLIGIPWRVAFALQADGWFLRQDIIWSKPNPMPESVRDRCTKAHEYIFLLSKNERYFYDSDAIAEPAQPESADRYNYAFSGAKSGQENAMPLGYSFAPKGMRESNGTRNKRSVWEVATQPFSEAHFAVFPAALIEPCVKAGCPQGGTVLDPFAGAGTTGLVADRLGRNAVLIELNPSYAEMIDRRVREDAGMFANVSMGDIHAAR